MSRALSETPSYRRALRFQDIDQILTDAENLAVQPYRTVGQWSLGQICAHLAIVMEQSLDGFQFSISEVKREAAVPLRRHLLTGPWPAGIEWSPAAAPVMRPPDQVVTGEGLERLRNAIHRLKNEPQRHSSPLFGDLSVEEWNLVHCRHAELHLSFVVPVASNSQT